MIETDRFEKVEIASVPELRAWLEANHRRAESVWIVRWKKSTPDKFVDRLDLLDELLCFGWIDGIARKLDKARTMQLISPRRQQAWSQSYKERVERLEQEGRMCPPGREAITRSKALGRWDTFAPVDALVIPDDLNLALRPAPQARDFFESTAPSYRRNVLRWIFLAKKSQTRAKRIAALVLASSRCEKIAQM